MKKYLLKLVSILLLSSISLTFLASCTNPYEKELETLSSNETIIENRQGYGIFEGSIKNFAVKINEQAKIDLPFEVVKGGYFSENPEIATVTSSGVITGHSQGLAKIRVLAEDGKVYIVTASVGFYVGIDVSSYNNNKQELGWEDIKNQGVDFMLIRSSYGSELYPVQVDWAFLRNVKGAIKNDIPFGIYHFGYALTEEEARLEALYCLKTIDDYIKEDKNYITLPIAYDLETDDMKYLDGDTLTKIVLAFSDEIKKAGFRPAVYAIHKIISKMDLEKLKNEDIILWYANPEVENPDFTVKRAIKNTGFDCDIWQYNYLSKMAGTADKGGIDGDTDINILYMSENDLTKKIYEALNLKALIDGKNIKLTFDKNNKNNHNSIKDFISYNIYRIDEDSEEKTPIIIGNTKNLFFIDENILPNKNYSYQVKTVTRSDNLLDELESEFSGKVSIVSPDFEVKENSFDLINDFIDNNEFDLYLTLDTSNFALRKNETHAIKFDLYKKDKTKLTKSEISSLLASGFLSFKTDNKEFSDDNKEIITHTLDQNFDILVKAVENGKTNLIAKLGDKKIAVRFDVLDEFRLPQKNGTFDLKIVGTNLS